ncbi:MAG: hypothetical protein WD116_04090 [Chloroflexota bacterium]
MPSLPRRLAAVAVLLLSLAIVAVLALRGMGFQVGFGPFASAPPVEGSASASPSGSPAASQDPLVVFAEIEREVRALRELPAASIGAPDVLTRAELAVILPHLLEPPLDNVTLRALGLLTADQDIVDLTEQLYTAQVLGFYDPDAKRMVIVSDAGLTPQARITYAHEYTHAMQDAAFDTAAAHEALVGQKDRELALIALEEGDATTAMVLWAIAHLTPEEMVGITETPLPDMTGIPDWMVRFLEFPYLSGAQFIGQLWASGGWDAVNEAYADPPSSTEQVLHPDAYIDGEAPLEVDGLDLWTTLGDDWAHATETTLGEAWIRIWLEGIGVDATLAARGADGWGGDWVAVADGGDLGWALGWRIAWDAPIEATEFEDAYAGAATSLPFAIRVVHASERETIVLHASSEQLLDQITQLAGG